MLVVLVTSYLTKDTPEKTSISFIRFQPLYVIIILPDILAGLADLKGLADLAPLKREQKLAPERWRIHFLFNANVN